MNQKDGTDALLPEWLAEHTAAIEQLCQSESDLVELIDDQARLTKAISYWSGKSEEKVEEFRCMAKELQYEIIEMLTQKRHLIVSIKCEVETDVLLVADK